MFSSTVQASLRSDQKQILATDRNDALRENSQSHRKKHNSVPANVHQPYDNATNWTGLRTDSAAEHQEN
jgi:hypothetical protein